MNNLPHLLLLRLDRKHHKLDKREWPHQIYAQIDFLNLMHKRPAGSSPHGKNFSSPTALQVVNDLQVVNGYFVFTLYLRGQSNI